MRSPLEILGNVARRVADRLAPLPPPPPPPPPPPENAYLKRCLSVEGEDLLIDLYLRRMPPGYYVDVGAHHPFRFSNTFLLKERGWSGINIDPNPESIEAFRQFRPGEANVQALVSDSTEPVTLYRFDTPALNTTDPAFRDASLAAGAKLVGEPVTLTPRRLSEILDEHLAPGQSIGLLSIDVENAEMAVLRSIDWTRHRPALIAIEVTNRLTMRDVLETESCRVLTGQGYEPVARTYSTAFFIDPAQFRGVFEGDLHHAVTPRELVRRQIERAEPRRVCLGASTIHYRGWVSTDVDTLDITSDSDWAAVFEGRQVDVMVAEHVFEHIPVDRIPIALRLCAAHLKPGARLRIAVPDAKRTDERYTQENIPPTSGHTIYFDVDSLSAAIRAAGMEPVPLEWFDDQGAFQRRAWRPEDGMIRRSWQFDRQSDFRIEHRGETLHYTSLIVDAVKPALPRG